MDQYTAIQHFRRVSTVRTEIEAVHYEATHAFVEAWIGHHVLGEPWIKGMEDRHPITRDELLGKPDDYGIASDDYMDICRAYRVDYTDTSAVAKVMNMNHRLPDNLRFAAIKKDGYHPYIYVEVVPEA